MESKLLKSARLESLQELEQKYPKCIRLSKTVDSDNYGSYSDLLEQKNPRLQMEKLVTYQTLTNNGPDVSWELLGRIIPTLRRALSGDILAAFESGGRGAVYRALDKMGMFGSKSDKLRHDGDKYW